MRERIHLRIHPLPQSDGKSISGRVDFRNFQKQYYIMKVTVVIEVSNYHLSYGDHPGMILSVDKEIREVVDYTIGKSWSAQDIVRVVDNNLTKRGVFTSEKIIDVKIEDNNDPLDHPERLRKSSLDPDIIYL